MPNVQSKVIINHKMEKQISSDSIPFHANTHIVQINSLIDFDLGIINSKKKKKKN